MPYLRSEYGKEYDFDAPVKLLEKMMHGMAQHKEEQVLAGGRGVAGFLGGGVAWRGVGGEGGCKDVW